MKVITIQPAQFTDDLWGIKGGEVVEGKKTPYPFSIDTATGDVLYQEFWQGDPSRVVGFQNKADVQRVDLWWADVGKNPGAIIGKFPVMVGPDGIYTYTLAIESFEVTEVLA